MPTHGHAGDGKEAVPPPAHPVSDAGLLLASMESPRPRGRNLDFVSRSDTERFMDAAGREGLAPLIYYSNRETIDGKERWSALSREYRATLGRNTVFLDKLRGVAAILEGIDFILLKGAYLAASVYPSPGLRRFSDIDILIRRDDLPEACGRLADAGYEPPRGQGPAGEAVPAVSDYLNSVACRHADGGPTLHVHWHLANSILPKYVMGHMDMDSVWRQARPTPDGWWELSPEHQITHLAEHALRHSFHRLILLRDIAEVIMMDGPSIRWTALVEECRRSGLTVPVYYSLFLVAARTAAPVPREVLLDLQPARAGFCARMFLKLAMKGRRFPEMCNLAYLGNMSSLSSKFGFLWHIVFPPRAVLAHAYHRKEEDVGFLLYLSRICRGMHSGIRATIRSYRKPTLTS